MTNENGYNPDGIEGINEENAPVEGEYPQSSPSGNNLSNMARGAKEGFKAGWNYDKNNLEKPEPTPAKGIPESKSSEDGMIPKNNGIKNNDAAKGVNAPKGSNENQPQSNISDNMPGVKKANDSSVNRNLPGTNKIDNQSGNRNFPGAKKAEEPSANRNFPGAKKANDPSGNRNFPGTKDSENKPLGGKDKNKDNNLRKNNTAADSEKAKKAKEAGKGGEKAGKTVKKAKDSEKVAAGIEATAQKGFVTSIKAFLATPYGKIALVVLLALLLLLIVIGLLISMANENDDEAICDSNSSSGNSENVSAADTMEFLCKMQSPLGTKSYVVTSYAGKQRSYEKHPGIDIGMPMNTPVYAAQSGTVIRAGWFGGYGNCVDIDHGSGFVTRYGHMPDGAIRVKKGDRVSKGQRIGSVGSTGRSTGPHLHFEMHVNNKVVYDQNAYFGPEGSKGIPDSFKKQCGAKWEGDPVGESNSSGNQTSSSSGDYSSSESDFSSSSSQCCVSSTPSSSSSSSNYCPNGITVGGKTINFEDYVAGVVTAENSYKSGNNIEASKAQAIAARTFALNSTHECSKSIANSQSAQVYTNPGSIGKQSATETAGQVMKYNGKVFSSQYDSFCGRGGTATYRKVPSNSTHSLTLSSKFRGQIAGGHCHGMSQLYARQLQDEGKKYDEILKFFYADGIEITGAGSSTCSLGGDSFSGKIWPYYQYNYSHVKYGSGSIASCGCGPTAMAMAVSSFLNEKHDPPELADFSTKNNCYVSGKGTAWNFFSKAGKKYGLSVKQLSKSNKDEVLTSLNSGKALVIAAMGPSTFTSGGHYILLTGVKDGKIAVQDPASEPRSKKTWGFNDPIVKEASQFWIIKKA